MENKPIIIEAPFGGWVSEPTTHAGSSLRLTGSVYGKENQYAISKAISLWSPSKYGSITPGQTFSKITDGSSYVNALPLNGNPTSQGSAEGVAYAVLKNCRLIGTNDGMTSIATKFDITAAAPNHAAHTVSSSTNNPDTITIVDAGSTPLEWVLWSWEDGSDADIAVIKKDGSAEDDDWFSTGSGSGVLRAGVPLKMCQGPDGNIYITNGQYIASAVMASGVALTSAVRRTSSLNLGSGYIASGITSYKNYIAICGYKPTSTALLANSNIRVWLWDGFSAEPNFIFDVRGSYANGIIYDNENLYLFSSTGSYNEVINVFTGSGFKPVFHSSYGIMTGRIPMHGAIEQTSSGLVFGNAASSIFKLSQGAIHEQTRAYTTTEASELGMIKQFNQGTLHIGAKIGTDYVIGYDASGGYYPNADFRTRMIELPFKAKYARIVIVFESFNITESSLFVSLFRNNVALDVNGTTDLLKWTINGTNNPGVARTLSASRVISVQDMTKFYMNLRFNHADYTKEAASVRRIEIYPQITDAKI